MKLTEPLCVLVKRIFQVNSAEVIQIEYTVPNFITLKLRRDSPVDFDYEDLERVSRLFGSKKFSIPEWEETAPGCATCGHGRSNQLLLTVNEVNFDNLSAQIAEITIELDREQEERNLAWKLAHEKEVEARKQQAFLSEQKRLESAAKKAAQDLEWSKNKDSLFEATQKSFWKFAEMATSKRHFAELVKEEPCPFILFLFFKQLDRNEKRLKELWNSNAHRIRNAFYPT